MSLAVMLLVSFIASLLELLLVRPSVNATLKFGIIVHTLYHYFYPVRVLYLY